MLVYIIDGFNLVHKVPDLKKSSEPHLSLIQYIKKNRLTGSSRNKVIIVFDGGINYEAQKEREFEVIFGCGTTADELIKRKVNSIKNKSQLVVVTDDREIKNYVRRAGASLVGVSKFVEKKRKTIHQPQPDKDISYSLQRQITEEMRRVWLKE